MSVPPELLVKTEALAQTQWGLTLAVAPPGGLELRAQPTSMNAPRGLLVCMEGFAQIPRAPSRATAQALATAGPLATLMSMSAQDLTIVPRAIVKILWVPTTASAMTPFTLGSTAIPRCATYPMSTTPSLRRQMIVISQQQATTS